MDEIRYLYLDARYKKVQESKQVRDVAALVATGITPDEERQVLGVSVSLSKLEIHWKIFLKALKDRGLNGVQLVIGDNHHSLGAVKRAVLGSGSWQRCQFHSQKNVGACVPRQSMLMAVAADIRSIFNDPDRKTAEVLLQAAVQKYVTCAPKLSAWLEDNLPDGLMVFNFPLEHRCSFCTINSLERASREIHRRTHMVGIFPNEVACLWLVSAILMEMSEDWQIVKRYCSGKSFVCKRTLDISGSNLQKKGCIISFSVLICVKNSTKSACKINPF